MWRSKSSNVVSRRTLIHKLDDELNLDRRGRDPLVPVVTKLANRRALSRIVAIPTMAVRAERSRVVVGVWAALRLGDDVVDVDERLLADAAPPQSPLAY